MAGQITALPKTEKVLNVILGTENPALLQHARDMADIDILSRAYIPVFYNANTPRSRWMDIEIYGTRRNANFRIRHCKIPYDTHCKCISAGKVANAGQGTMQCTKWVRTSRAPV